MSYMIAPEYRRNSHLISESESEAKTKCSLFDRCEGCPYPKHGFVCWGKDGQCMRTDMEKIKEREMKRK